MPDQPNISELGTLIFTGAKDSLDSNFKKVKHFLFIESEKLALTLQMIIEGIATGDIDKEEAKILLGQQQRNMSSILTAAKGISLVAAHVAIDGGLALVKKFGNDKIGFQLV
jgi:hypothetical protein